MSIQNRVRSLIPATYDAMLRATTYGQAMFDSIIESTKFRLFGTVRGATVEDTYYNSFHQDYVARVAVIRIIPAGVDYWSDEVISENTREEQRAWPDRRESLWKIQDHLIAEVRADQAFFERDFPPVLLRSARGLARVNTLDDLLTPDPQDFGPKFGKRRAAGAYSPFGGWS